MNNCRDEQPDADREVYQSYSFDDARTGYNGLSFEENEEMNQALSAFLKSRGKLHTMKEIMNFNYKKRYGKN